MSWTVTTYVAYLCLAIPLTVWVARVLFRHGQAFLDEAFPDNHTLAAAVNRLLVVGFYLLNLGFVSLYLAADHEVVGVQGLLENLSRKVGVVALVLGTMHVLNVYVANAMRRHRRAEALRPAWAYPQPGYPANYQQSYQQGYPQAYPQAYGQSAAPVRPAPPEAPTAPPSA